MIPTIDAQVVLAILLLIIFAICVWKCPNLGPNKQPYFDAGCIYGFGLFVIVFSAIMLILGWL